MDYNGNLINPDTGEVVAPSETETGTDMPATEPTTPQEPETRRSRCLHRRRKRLHRRRKRLRQRRDAGGAG